MSEPTIPTAEEIAGLPRWARVAFAARCARRVWPCYQLFWPDAPAEHAAAVIDAIAVTTRAAAVGVPPHSRNAGDAALAASVAVRTDESGGEYAAAAALAASVAAVAAATAASEYAAGYAARASAAAAVAAVHARHGMRVDFDALVAAKQQWTDDTPVPPEFFGPLWPDGPPPEWPAGLAACAPVSVPEEPEQPVSAQPVLPSTRVAPSPGPQLPARPYPWFAIGDRVAHAEKWELVEKLGRGGFGEVWLARHRQTGAVRAVKFCTHAVARDQLNKVAAHESNVAEYVQKHTSEPGGCHPNIVPLLECNLTGDTPWLMYEYVPGGRALADVIEELKALPVTDRVARAVPLLYTIAAAVGRFHRLERRIVHRDLTPKNVLMAGDVPRITDFGIGGAAVVAALADATGRTDFTVHVPTMLRAAGTPPHASPEQLEGKLPDPRDDVYALGVMTYQMLVGKQTAEVKGNWQRGLRTDAVPEPLIELIGDSTSELEHRPQDAAAWAEVLAALLPDAPVGAAPLKRFVPVPGVWWWRPATNPDMIWQRAGYSGYEMNFYPDRSYYLHVEREVTDTELERLSVLAGVPPFAVLELRNCRRLTSLAPLANLTSLTGLGVSGVSAVTDLRPLARLTNLVILDLRDCMGITDLGPLAELSHLKGLDLHGCEGITDLTPLTGLTNLKELRLSGCGGVIQIPTELQNRIRILR